MIVFRNAAKISTANMLLIASVLLFASVQGEEKWYEGPLSDAYVNFVNDSLDPTWRSCENFYEYACKLAQTTENPSYRSRAQDYLDETVEGLLEAYMKKYESPDETREVDDHVVQMLKVYRSCTKRDELVEKAPQTTGMKNFFSDIFAPNRSEERSVFSSLVRLSLVWGLETPLLNFEVKPGLPGNAERIVIQGAKVPSSTRPPRQFAMNPSPFADIETEMKALRRELLDAVEAQNKRNDIRDDSLEETVIQDMIHYSAVESFVRNVSSKTKYFAKVDDFYVGTFESLENDHKLDWATALNFNLRPLLQITPETRVEVHNLGFAMAFAELTMDRRFHEVFAGYLHHWLALLTYSFSGAKPIEAVCKVTDCKTNNMSCMQQIRTLMPWSYNAIIAHHLLPSRASAALTLNVLVNQAHLAQLIKQTDWIPKKSRAMMIHKIVAMMIYVGHPPHLNDAKGVEHKMVPRRYFALNVLHIRKARAEHRLASFYRKYVRQGVIWSLLDSPATSEPSYDTHLNAIVVPSSYAMPPFMANLGDFVPGVLDAASLGLGIGKALARAFDIENGAYNHWGERVLDENSWLFPISKQLKEKRACYENLSPTSIEWSDGTVFSYQDSQSPDEIQADVIAFELLQHGREYWRTLSDYPVMGKLKELTVNQMSYIAATLPYCTQQQREALEDAIRTKQPMEAFRFKKFLRILPDFRDAFECEQQPRNCSFFT